MIDVSVIIPVYNTARWLPACLDSVLCQSLRNIEVLCFDDGSSDDSVAVLRDYSARDARIKFRECRHCGAGAIRNHALDIAQGRFVAFMDSDDLYPEPETLEKLVRAADEHNVEVAGGYAIGFSGEDVGDWRSKKPSEFYFHGHSGIIEYLDIQTPYGYTCYVYRRRMLNDFRIRFPALTRFEDPVFFVRALLAAQRFYAIDFCVYLYRGAHKQVPWSAKDYALRKEQLRGATELLRVASDNGLVQLRRTVLSEAIGGVSDRACYRAVRKELKDFMRTVKNGMTPHDRAFILHWIVRDEPLACRLWTAACVLGPCAFARAVLTNIKCRYEQWT